ncbi:hypothetical protein ACRE_009470 [Hapsidospora chrysogenum ATCC 11550]|uniref:Uncharacterized protein n=1 Tax=Hapsidospora chrysogenum (strain ATCC 11550 / CBS 779.69 / DSM 880 / IAM 14645 / JCM 23072 / IMI 49137) TaxID=857340 RepID=A0A086TFT6_HAPC1|nr:hypothetical protein ACRE_009470 [Hapsidospora chrysogenum ATCC 11550]
MIILASVWASVSSGEATTGHRSTDQPGRAPGTDDSCDARSTSFAYFLETLWTTLWMRSR